MIRLYEPTARWLVMVLQFCNERRVSVQDIITSRDSVLERVSESGVEYSPTEIVEMRAIGDQRDNETPLPTYEELLDPLVKQLGGEEPNEATLIDRVVQILQLHYPRNIVAGKTLQSLRNAILTRDELAGLEERIAAANTHCAKCGKEFRHGEAAVSEMDNNGRVGSFVFTCHRCRKAVSVACEYPNCDATVPVDWKDFGKRQYCENHPGGREIERAEEPQIEIDLRTIGRDEPTGAVGDGLYGGIERATNPFGGAGREIERIRERVAQWGAAVNPTPPNRAEELFSYDVETLTQLPPTTRPERIRFTPPPEVTRRRRDR